MKYKTLKEQIEAVRKNPCSMRDIKNPPLKVQLLSVRHWGFSIEYIDNPCLEVQLEAVQQNAYAIKYIENPPIEVQVIAIKKIDVTFLIHKYKSKFNDITYDVIMGIPSYRTRRY